MSLILDFNKTKLPQIKSLLKQLGGARRVEVLKYISGEKEWSITDLAKRMNCGIANLSQQITELEKAGLIIKQTAKITGGSKKIIKPVYKEIVIKL